MLVIGYAASSIPLIVGWALLKAPVVAATLIVDPITGLPPLIPPLSLPPESFLSTTTRVLTGLFTWPSDYLLLARNAALIKLWVWSSPLLIILAVYGAILTRISLLRHLVACALFTLLAYYLIRFDQGLGWGYRYFHPAYIVLPLLATAALLHLERHGLHRRQWQTLGPALALSGLLLLIPLHASQMEQRVASARAQMPPHIEGRGLYLFSGKGYCQGLRCDLLQNDPLLRGDVYLIKRPYDNLNEAYILNIFPGARLSDQNEYGRSYTLPDDWRPPTARTDTQR